MSDEKTIDVEIVPSAMPKGELPIPANTSKHAMQAYELPDPQKLFESAARVATLCVDIIDKQKLFDMIKGKRHVKVDGWTTLAFLMGASVKVNYAKEVSDGTFEADVMVINGHGVVVGGCSHICSRSETRWKSADKYAIRSMAITRATSKALRLKYGWILSLAGYDATELTPLEEMPYEPDQHKRDLKEELKHELPPKETPYFSGTDAQKTHLHLYLKNNDILDKNLMKFIYNHLLTSKTPLHLVEDEIAKYTLTHNEKGERI